jgi:hypothetical protein
MSSRPTFPEWCRNQPCACHPCGARAEAHHSTTDDTRGRRRGKGQKSSDDACIPLCAKHHHQFHELTGFFGSFTKPLIRSWQANQVKVHRDKYEAQFGELPKTKPRQSKILPRLPIVASESEPHQHVAPVINLDTFRDTPIHAVPNLIVWVADGDVALHENTLEHLTAAQCRAISKQLLSLAETRK